MNKIFSLLAVFAASVSFAEPMCAVMYYDFRYSPPKEVLVSGTELKNPLSGSFNRAEWIMKNSEGKDAKFVFVIDNLGPTVNGCHYVYTATGFEGDNKTIFNTFNNWCEGQDLQIYHPALVQFSSTGASVTCRF